MAMNLIVGQSGGPTAVINSSLAGVYETAKNLGVNKVYGMLYGIEGLLQEKMVDLDEMLGDIMSIELLKRTPSSYLGSCRCKLPTPEQDESVYETLFRLFDKYEIGALLYIGGNDSMDTIAKLSAYGARIRSEVRFIGVPKTIDNDLMLTDHTPGYGSAAKYIGVTVKELVRDSTIYDLKSITVVEIMGRNAGWLAAAAALAEGEDCEGPAMICLPEVPFDTKRFVGQAARLQSKTPSLVIAVSEGVRTADGRYVAELGDSLSTDPFGHKNLTGTARYLCSLLGERLHTKTRAVELSTLQRCAAHIASQTDVQEAYQAGGAAARAAFEGRTGMMVGLTRLSDDPYLCVTELHDIHHVANFEKMVSEHYFDAENGRMKPAFLDYALPLIQSEVTQTMVRGLPQHLRLT